MPKALDDCVTALMADPDFKPRKGQDKRAAAFAVCTARLGDKAKETTEELVTTPAPPATKLRITSYGEATLREKTGAEWSVRIINAGLSENNNFYPLEVLHRDKDIFESVPVYAARGDDHSPFERGTGAVVGIIKNVIEAFPNGDDPGGLDATFRASDPNLRAVLLDLHQEGVLNSMIGFSIVAEGFWEENISKGYQSPRRAKKLTKAESVDLVREPAAGGKFHSVTESLEEQDMVGVAEDRVKEIAAKAAQEAAAAALDALLKKQESEKAAEEEAAKKKAEEEEAAKLKAEKEEAEKSKESEEEEKEETSPASEAVMKLRKEMESELSLMRETRIHTAILRAKLPEASEKRLLATFKNGSFTPEEVEEAITAEKEHVASIQKVTVENLTKERSLIIVDEQDKTLARMDAMFDMSGKIEMDTAEGKRTVKAFSGFKESYCAWTGRHPYNLETEEVWEAWANGSGGYASWRESKIEKMYEALQQSDWGEVSADRMHKALIRNYDNLPQYQDWRKVARVMSANDLQAHRQIKVGGYADLTTVVERGTYPDLTQPADEETTVTVTKRGGIAPQITRELIINDNVGAIAEIPKELARSAARTLYKHVFDIFVNNDTYGPDSTALFDASHGGNTGTAALTQDAVGAITQVMRSQTKYGSSNDVLGAANLPRIIMVPNELQGIAERIFNPTNGALYVPMDSDNDTESAEDPYRFRGTAEVIVVDYWTDANDYVMAADPNQVNGIGVAFLNGNEEPELFIQRDERVGEMFTQDVQNIKIRHEYGSVIMDYRPFFKQVVA